MAAELLPDLIAAVEPLKPIELKVEFPTPADRELKREFRNRYSDYIQKELPKLAEIIGAQWDTRLTTERENQGLPGGGLMGPGDGFRGRVGAAGLAGMDAKAGMDGMPGAAGMGRGHGWTQGQVGEDPHVVVNWSPTNQAALQTASFDWTRPTTLQILYAQENLWVLRALMLVIKATNGDADAQYNAAIKEIMAIELGRAAAGITSSGQVSRGPNSSGEGAEPGDTRGGGKMGPEMMLQGKTGPGKTGPGMTGPGMTGPGKTGVAPE